MATRKKPSGQDAVRITTAAASREADIAARQVRYVLSMAVRVVCFIAAVVVGPGWLRWVLVAAAVLLPYVAVVMANVTDTRDDTFSLRDAPPQHELPPGAAGPAVPPAQDTPQDTTRDTTRDDTENGGRSA